MAIEILEQEIFDEMRQCCQQALEHIEIEGRLHGPNFVTNNLKSILQKINNAESGD